MTNRFRGILYAATTAVLFAVLGIVLKYSLRFADAGTIIFVRFVVAFFAQFLVLRLTGAVSVRGLLRPPYLAVLAGLFLAGNYLGYMKGLEYTSPGNAQILIQLAPLMLALIGVFGFKEHIDRVQKFGMVIALTGLAFYYRDQISNLSASDTPAYNLGNIWILFSAFCWAAWGAAQKWLGHRMSAQVVNLFVYLVAGICSLSVVKWSDFENFDLYISSLMIILGLSTVLAYATIGEALKLIPVHQVSLIIILNPILTLVLIELSVQLGWNWAPAGNISALGYLGAVLFLSGVITVVTHRT
jgi:drug/metabolite transporter (DMT)-like permease